MSREPVTIVLLGDPVPWARAGGGRSRKLFTPTRQRNNAAALRMAAQEAMKLPPFDEPVKLELLAEIAIPRSWSKRKQAEALAGYLTRIRPASKPDLSNIVKQVEDALNSIVYRDDALIVDVHASKVYGAQPKLIVTISPID